MKLEDNTEALYNAFKKLQEYSPSVPLNMLHNHDINFIGVKHVYGSEPKNIYQGQGLTVYTIPEVLPISKHVQYESIDGVYRQSKITLKRGNENGKKL